MRGKTTLNNTTVCWVFEISILLISLLWLRRYSSADKFVHGTERENEMMPTFSYFTKTCLKLQYGICGARQMHIEWNWTMNSRPLICSVSEGEIHHKWISQGEKNMDILYYCNPHRKFIPNQDGVKSNISRIDTAVEKKSSLKWSGNYFRRKEKKRLYREFQW